MTWFEKPVQPFLWLKFCVSYASCARCVPSTAPRVLNTLSNAFLSQLARLATLSLLPHCYYLCLPVLAFRNGFAILLQHMFRHGKKRLYETDVISCSKEDSMGVLMCPRKSWKIVRASTSRTRTIPLTSPCWKRANGRTMTSIMTRCTRRCYHSSLSRHSRGGPRYCTSKSPKWHLCVLLLKKWA